MYTVIQQSPNNVMRLIALVIIIPIAIAGALWWYFEVRGSRVYTREVLPLWQDMALLDTEPEFSDAILADEHDYQGALEVLARRRAHVERIQEKLDALEPSRRTQPTHENFQRLTDDYLEAINSAERKAKALAAAQTIQIISRQGDGPTATTPTARMGDVLKYLETYVPTLKEATQKLLSGKVGDVLNQALPPEFRARWHEAEPMLDAFLKILRSQGVELSADTVQKSLRKALEGFPIADVENFLKLLDVLVATNPAREVLPQELLTSTGGTGGDEFTTHAQSLGETMGALQKQYPDEARSAGITLSVKGVARTSDGMPVSALVWAWSEKGRSLSSRASADGAFELQLASRDKWHVGAAGDIGGFPYRSAEIVLAAEGEAPFLELTLMALRPQPLPQPVRVVAPATDAVAAETADGAHIKIPARAALSSGTIAVEVNPTIEVVSLKHTRVVGIAYDVAVKTAAGEEVKTFREDVTITLPYRDEDLAVAGASESTISPSFFDAARRVWVRIRAFEVDVDKNIVTARVRHFTRFALVAPADTMPPDPPSDIRVSESVAGFAVSWANPSYDFHHAKIYRSEAQEKIGRVIANNLKESSYLDTSEKHAGRTYYYVVRSVDFAGNESLNMTPVSVRATTSATATPLVSLVAPVAPAQTAASLPSQTTQESVVPQETGGGFWWHLKNIWRAVVAFFHYLL